MSEREREKNNSFVCLACNRNAKIENKVDGQTQQTVYCLTVQFEYNPLNSRISFLFVCFFVCMISSIR